MNVGAEVSLYNTHYLWYTVSYFVFVGIYRFWAWLVRYESDTGTPYQENCVLWLVKQDFYVNGMAYSNA